MRKLPFFLLCTSVLAFSCSKDFYQVLTAQSNDVEIHSGYMIYDDENCQIIYNLWAPYGNAGFLVYNKTDQNIIIDLKRSFFVRNDNANDYYKNRTYSYGVSSNVRMGKSASKSTNNSKSESNSLSTSTLNASTYWPSSYSIDGETTSSTKTTSSSAGLGQTKNTSIQFGEESSIEFREQELVYIPPRTSKSFTEYEIMSELYRECEFQLAPKKSKNEHLKYSYDNSPIRFGNIITYILELSNSPITVRHDFFVADISNMTASDFKISISADKNCIGFGQNIPTKKDIYKEQAPNKFFIPYKYRPQAQSLF